MRWEGVDSVVVGSPTLVKWVGSVGVISGRMREVVCLMGFGAIMAGGSLSR